MKAYLVFKLPEDQEEFRLATKAGEMSSALWAISQAIRGRLKYGDPSPSSQEVETLEAIRALIPSLEE